MRRYLITLASVIGYVTAVFIVDILLMGLSEMFFGDWASGIASSGSQILKEGLFLVLSISLVNLVITYTYGSEYTRRGWPNLKTGFKGFVKGGYYGVLAAGGMLLLTWVSGGGKLTLDNFSFLSYLIALAPLLFVLLISSLGEEWIFRGVPFTLLNRVAGRGWTNVIFALLFAVAHAGSTGMNWLVFINVVLGGLILGALRFTTAGIPVAWGFHFAWNSMQVLCGSTLSGEQLSVPGVQFYSEGPGIISGGKLGPEGGLGATVSTVLVLTLIARYCWRRGDYDLPIPALSRVFHGPRTQKNS